jgi:hypothetical protein
MKLAWAHAFTICDSYGSTKVYAFGPFVMYEFQGRGFFQIKRVFIDHLGKTYRTEDAFIHHIDYLAKKSKQG